jgi:hypothetical protein
MDIKSLHDAAMEGGINLDNEDSWKDCEQVWLEACLCNQEFMTEYLGDFLCELTTQDNIATLARWMGSVAHDREFIASGDCIPGLIDAYAQSLGMYQANIGTLVATVAERECRAVVKQHLHDWFADVRGYHLDMQRELEEMKHDRVAEDRREERLTLREQEEMRYDND